MVLSIEAEVPLTEKYKSVTNSLPVKLRESKNSNNAGNHGVIKSTSKKEIIIAGDSMINDTHKENCVSGQELIEIEAWLYLTFLLCLYNKLIYTYSTVTY